LSSIVKTTGVKIRKGEERR